jgi:hypothetical protein
MRTVSELRPAPKLAVFAAAAAGVFAIGLALGGAVDPIGDGAPARHGHDTPAPTAPHRHEGHPQPGGAR